MIYAIIDNTEYVFNSWSEYNTFTFSPAVAAEVDYITDFTVKGSDYKTRQAAARDICIDISNRQCGGLSWYEVMLLQGKLETLGKRYGLLTELRENAMI